MAKHVKSSYPIFETLSNKKISFVHFDFGGPLVFLLLIVINISPNFLMTTLKVFLSIA